MTREFDPPLNRPANGALNTPFKAQKPASQKVSRDAVLAFVQERVGRMSALEIALAVTERFPDGAQITMGEIAQMERAARSNNDR